MLERMYEPSGLSPASLAACRARTKYFCAVGWSPTSYDIQPASSASSAATLNSLDRVASVWGSCNRSVTSCSWPTTALRRRPPPHWASQRRNITAVDSSRSSSGLDRRPRAREAGAGSRPEGEADGEGTSQRCMGSMRGTGPAERGQRASEEARRAAASGRCAENSLSRATGLRARPGQVDAGRGGRRAGGAQAQVLDGDDDAEALGEQLGQDPRIGSRGSRRRASGARVRCPWRCGWRPTGGPAVDSGGPALPGPAAAGEP